MTNDEKASRTHRDLPVWQRAMALAEAIYKLTDDFSAEDSLGLMQPLRNAAVAVPSCIAEGAGRASSNDLGHYLGAALGKVAEVETLLELAKRLDIVDDTNLESDLLEDVRKQLIMYRRSLRA